MMKSIKESISTTTIIEKSKFIAFLMPVHSKEEFEQKLNFLKKEYIDATHICYATIIKEETGFFYKSFDDGEPSSTAGAPILNVLKKNELENIACFVIRYFGGIKLGAGGLCRAYSKACSEAVRLAQIVTLKIVNLYEIHVSYENERLLSNLLKNMSTLILEKKYEMNVLFKVVFKEEKDLELLKNNYNLHLEINIIGTYQIEE